MILSERRQLACAVQDVGSLIWEDNFEVVSVRDPVFLGPAVQSLSVLILLDRLALGPCTNHPAIGEDKVQNTEYIRP